MTTVNETILSRDVEFDTYAEMKAFLKGLRYEATEKLEVLSVAFYDTTEHTKNGKHVVSVRFETR